MADIPLLHDSGCRSANSSASSSNQLCANCHRSLQCSSSIASTPSDDVTIVYETTEEHTFQATEAAAEAETNETTHVEMEKVDIISKVNGEFGRWQLRTVLLIFLCKIPSAWFMACIIFTAPAPRPGEFFCRPSTNVLNANTTTKWLQILDANKTDLIKAMHPLKEMMADDDRTSNAYEPIDFCNVFSDADVHAQRYFHSMPSARKWRKQKQRNVSSIVPCESFMHHTDYKSIITDYDLVCSRDILVATTQSLHLFGVLMGGILSTNLLKFFSPKSVMLFGMIALIVCGNLTGLVETYELHVFFRCLSAVSCAQMYTAGQMIFADITDGRPKIIITTLFETFWSLGLIMLPFIASLFDSWSHLYMAISCLTFILIFSWRWIPNSPRWLIAHNHVNEAEAILIESAAMNQRKHLLPSNLTDLLANQARNVQSDPLPPSWWTLFKGENAVRNMSCVHLCWSIYIIVYYGMLLNIRAFSREHLEINTIVAALCEILGDVIGLMLILFTQRKWLYTGLFNIFAGIVSYSAWLIPIDIDDDLRVALLMCSSMVLKVSVSCTLAILTTCTTELVAQEKKKICSFSTIVWARFWLLGGPYVGATIMFGQLVPQTLFTTMAVVGGVLSTLIISPIARIKHSNLPKELTPDIYTIKKIESMS